MDSAYSPTAFVFTKPNSFDGVFAEVDLSSDWGIMIISEDGRVCDKYGVCIIPFYEFDFSITGLHLPFTTFEIEVLNHLVVAPLELHPFMLCIYEILSVLV